MTMKTGFRMATQTNTTLYNLTPSLLQGHVKQYKAKMQKLNTKLCEVRVKFNERDEARIARASGLVTHTVHKSFCLIET